MTSIAVDSTMQCLRLKVEMSIASTLQWALKAREMPLEETEEFDVKAKAELYKIMNTVNAQELFLEAYEL